MRHRTSARWCALVLGSALLLAGCGGSSDGGGDAGASSAATSPSPSVDPLTVARMDGVYDVVKEVTQTKNFNDIKKGDTFKRTYTVTPDCETGPCGGQVSIEYKESDETSKFDLTYDEAGHTFSMVFPDAPVVCTGVDGKKYKLDTTRDFEMTPTSTTAEGDLVVVTEFSGLEHLKAEAMGAAKSKGKCEVSTATYSYTGTQQ